MLASVVLGLDLLLLLHRQERRFLLFPPFEAARARPIIFRQGSQVASQTLVSRRVQDASAASYQAPPAGRRGRGLILQGSTARPGTQWYYRVNPTNNQRCWFLGHEGLKARSRAREGASPMPAPNPTSTHENAGEAARETPAQVTAAQIASPETAPLIAPAQGASAEVGFTEPSFGEDATAIDFAARWPDLAKGARLPAGRIRSRGLHAQFLVRQVASVCDQEKRRHPISAGLIAALRAG